MNTAFCLLAQYDGAAVIPLDRACRDYFGLTPDKFLRKVSLGEISIPVVRMGPTQKSPKGIHLSDLAAFTRACKVLGIEDLHFHDLRHEGVSRLFELGKTIPQVACFSGHRSWQSLQRYAHIRESGDKYAEWRRK